jgi:hypothetical protein
MHHGQIGAEQLPADTRTPRNSAEPGRAASAHTSDELLAAERRSSCGRNSNEQPGSYHVSNVPYGSASLGGTVESESLDATGDSVSTGLERWKAAISLTTMQMMERRMQSMHATPPGSVSGGAQKSSAAPAAGQQHAPGAPAGAAAARLPSTPEGALGLANAAAAGRGTAVGMGARSSNSSGAASAVQQPQPLRLQTLIGQGSFGSVYLGTW